MVSSSNATAAKSPLAAIKLRAVLAKKPAYSARHGSHHVAQTLMRIQRCPGATWCWRKSMSPMANTGSIGARCSVAFGVEVRRNVDCTELPGVPAVAWLPHLGVASAVANKSNCIPMFRVRCTMKPVAPAMRIRLGCSRTVVSSVVELDFRYFNNFAAPNGNDIEVRLNIRQKWRFAMALSEPETTLTPVRGLTVNRDNRMIQSHAGIITSRHEPRN